MRESWESRLWGRLFFLEVGSGCGDVRSVFVSELVSEDRGINYC